MGELWQPGVGEEALEAEDTGIVKWTELIQVCRDQSSQETDVDLTLALCRLFFDLERVDIDRDGDAVERHVDQRRDPAGSCCGRCALEALPVGMPGLVHVHVGIDQTGHEHDVRIELDRLIGRERGIQRRDGGDTPVAHADGTGDLTFSRNERSRRPDDEIERLTHYWGPSSTIAGSSSSSPAMLANRAIRIETLWAIALK